MKKNYYHILMALLSLFLTTACDKEEVQPFSAQPGVNFQERFVYNNKVTWGDGYTNLYTSINFITAYEQSYGEMERSSMGLRIKLEGQLSDKPLKVKLKVEPVEDYELADVTLPEEIIEIKPGEYTADFTIEYGKPAMTDKEYAAQIVVDYANSDVVAGTKERQAYLLNIQDTFSWETIEIESEAEWDQYFKKILGDYGAQKIRFLLYAFRQLDAEIGDAAYYTRYYPNYDKRYGFSKYIGDVISLLNEYNAAHPDAPVQESDGTPVTFPQP